MLYFAEDALTTLRAPSCTKVLCCLILYDALTDSAPPALTGEICERIGPAVEHGQAHAIARGLVGVPVVRVDEISGQPLPYLLFEHSSQPEVAAVLTCCSEEEK